MKNFNYDTCWKSLLTPEIVSLLTQIHEYKGRHNLFVETRADILTQLVETAKIHSTEASSKIEGILISDERLKKIVKDKTSPQNRNEQEIAGYRDVLAAIQENHDFIPLKPTWILQLHKDLFKYTGSSYGGNYKTANALNTEVRFDGKKHVRFYPEKAGETPETIDMLCKAYEDITRDGTADPLLIIPMFTLDFLCIRPFSDGNGRMSRLLTLLLLYRAGYIVGKYISIESLIERTKDTYYEALLQSSENWHENKNDYRPFVQYMLGLIAAAYREFETQADILIAKGLSKTERIAEAIKGTSGKITKRELLEKCPGISEITVQRALSELLKNGDIVKISGGRYTSYVWIRENKKI